MTPNAIDKVRHTHKTRRNARLATAAAIGLFGMATAAAPAETYLWNNTSGNWSDAARWTNGVPVSNAGTVLQFGAGAADYTATFDLPSGFELNRIDLTASPSGTNVITAPTLGSTLDFVANGGTAPQLNLNGNGTFRIANNLRVAEGTNLSLNVDPSSYLVFSGAASPGVTGQSINPVTGTTSTVTLNGGGTVVWRTVNTQNIIVNNGLLTTDADGGFLGDADVTIGATGVVDLGGWAEGYNSLSGVAGSVLRGNASVGGASGTYRYDGIITNRPAGGLDIPGYGLTGRDTATNSTISKSGGHTFIVSGANTHSGNTTVSGGTLVYAGDPFTANETKGFATGAITSSPFGTGTLVLSQTGTVAIEPGVNRTIANPFTISATPAGSAGATIDVPAGSELTTTGTGTFTGTVTKTGPGLWRHGGGNGAAVGTSVLNINGGTVRVADISGGDFNAIAINVNDTGTFEFGTSPALGGSENPDLPGGTMITANTGGNVIWNIGEDFGGIILNGGSFVQRGNMNLTGTEPSEFRSGSFARHPEADPSATPGIGGGQVINKTTAGTVTLSGIPINATGGVNIREGVLATDAGFGGATGVISFGAAADASNPATSGTLRYTGDLTTGVVARPVLVTEGGGTVDVVNPAAVVTLGGVASGPGSLVKSGPGRLILSNANTYSGGTTVAGGVLQVGDGIGGGSLAGNVSINAGATLAFSRSDAAATFPGNITGAGGVSVLGPGTTTFSGSLSHTGPTSVAAGTLRLPPANLAGPAAVAAGATLSVVNPANAAGTLSVPSLNLGDGSTVRFELDQGTLAAAPLIAVTGNNGLVLDGAAHTLDIVNQKTIPVGTTTLIDYSGAAITSGFTLSSLPARTQGGLVYNTAATRIDLVVTGSDTIRWGGQVNANWDQGSAVNVGGTQNFRLFSSNAATNFIQNDVVTFDDTATGSTAVNLNTTLEPSTVNVDNAAKTYTFQGGGGIGGSAALVKSGTGSLTILTANSYTGGTTVNGGTLNIGNGGSTGDIGSGPLVNNATVVWNRDGISFAGPITNNGTLTKSGSSTMTLTGPLTGTGAVHLPAGTLNLDTSSSYTYAGTVNGDGGLTKTGAGTVILAGNNTYKGLTQISSGPLQVGSGGTAGSIAGDINVNGISLAGGALHFNRSDTHTIPGNISSSGRIVNIGTGNTILTGVVSQDPINPGQIVADAGTLTLANPETSGLFSGINANVGGTIALDTTAGDQLHYGTFGGRGTILKTGPGTATLTANNPHTGTLQINQGTLVVSDPGAGAGTAGDIDSEAIVVNSGGVFQFGEGGVSGENPDLPNSTYLVINPGGVVNWRVGEQIGGTHLQGGTLNMAGGAPSNYGLTPGIWTHGTLTGTANTPGGSINTGGTGTIIKNTAGTVTVTGDARIGVAVTIEEGTIAYASANNLNGQAVTLGTSGGKTGTFEYQGATPPAARGGTFTYAGTGVVRVTQADANLTLSGVQAGAGSLTKDGPGTLTLTGNNTLGGGVNVSAGMLLVNGQTAANSGTGTGPVSVASGASIGGSGSIGGPLTISSGGRLSPGNHAANTSAAGVMTLAQTVTFAADSVFEVQLAGVAGTPVAGTDFDQLVVRGTGQAVTITDGARLSLLSTGGTFVEGQVFQLLNQTGGGSIAGTFRDTSGSPLTDGSQFMTGGQLFQISYGGGDVTLTAVPEPASLGLIAVAGGLLLGRRRRRH